MLMPDQNGQHFADNIFKRILLNEKFFYFVFQISLKIVPEGQTDHTLALG